MGAAVHTPHQQPVTFAHREAEELVPPISISQLAAEFAITHQLRLQHASALY
jgi:hypothetical protein